MKIEIYNSDYDTLGTFTMLSNNDIEDFANNVKKLCFVLRCFTPQGLYMVYTSLSFRNICDKLQKERANNDRLGINNKYTISIEEAK